MSMYEATGWSLLHAATAMLVAVIAGRMVVGWLRSRDEAEPRSDMLRFRGRGFGWALLLIPLLTPTLVVGYAYSGFSLAIVRYSWLNEALYVALLVARLTPIAALVLYFAPPPPLSAEALHCARLAGTGRRGSRRAASPSPPAARREPRPLMYRRPLSAWSMAIRGPARNIVLAAVVVFLLAVADFQLASLMNIPAWTVWMFDAQAGGLALSSSLSYAILPGTIEVAVLAPAVWILNGCEAAESTGTRLVRQPAWAGVLTWLYLIAALGVATILPASVLLLDASAGVAALGQNKTLWGELVVSMTYASCAAGSASSLPSD